VGVVGEGAAPTVEVVIDEVVIGFEFLPGLLPQVELFAVVEVAADGEDLVLELDGLVAQVPALVHLLEVDQFVRVDVELEDLLVEALRPAAAEHVDGLALGDCGRVGEGEEELGGEDGPLVGLGVVDLDGRQPLLAVVAAEDVDAAVADDGGKGAARGVESADGAPLLVEDVVGLAAGHALVLAVVAADDVDLAVEVDAGVLLPREVHGLALLEAVLLARGVLVAVAAGPAPGDEDLARGESAGRGVVLDLAVVDGGERVAVGQRAQGQDLLALPEEADLRGHLVADLDEVLVAGEGHY
jgi:hypothetical protein